MRVLMRVYARAAARDATQKFPHVAVM